MRETTTSGHVLMPSDHEYTAEFVSVPEHYLTAMGQFGGMTGLACRCGELILTTYVSEAKQQWLQHLAASQSE